MTVEVIDVSDERAPAHIDNFSAPGAHGLALTQDSLFGVLAVIGDGIRVLSLPRDGRIQEVGAFDLIGASGAEYAHDLVLLGNIAVVAAGSQGLWIIDIAERERPRPLGPLL